jgi:hypothetical protein
LSLSGKLPAGLTFTAGAHGTATISGSPAVTAAKRYPLTIVAVNRAGSVRQSFTLTVTSPPTFTSARNVTVKGGRRFSFTIRTTGYPVATRLSASGTGRGVVFRNNGNGTATLTGVLPRRGKRVLLITARSTVGVTTQSLTVKVV